MGSGLRRAGGFVIGLVLFLFGFSLLQPDSGLAQTGVNVALAAVLTALGIGVIAAAALPHTLEVSGQQFKPLGLDVKASGGAAVFLLTLGFIYYMKDHQGALAAPPEAPATEVAGNAPAPTSRPTGEPLAPDPEAEPAPITALANNAAFDELRQQFAAPQAQAAGYYLAWTWCSTCCPQGPDYCAQVGLGEGPTPDEAGYYAAEMCIRNGGVPQTCAANVQYLSAEDIAELGY